jgi:hypothetical protein
MKANARRLTRSFSSEVHRCNVVRQMPEKWGVCCIVHERLGILWVSDAVRLRQAV